MNILGIVFCTSTLYEFAEFIALCLSALLSSVAIFVILFEGPNSPGRAMQLRRKYGKPKDHVGNRPDDR